MNTNRITIVDALRGFALLLIILIHFAEHFELFHEAQYHFLFSKETDDKVLSLVFIILSGKAFSVFALLFGFSFYIQLSRGEQRGVDFRLRFFWRLIVLLILGFLHSLIYKGDILHTYAILGLFLIPLYKLNTKLLIWISALFAVQVPAICLLIYSFNNPEYVYTASFGSGLWELGNKIYSTGSFKDVISHNLWLGRSSVWGWSFYNGRLFQLFALFIAGLIAGRKKIFENTALHKKFLVKTLYISLIAAILLIAVKSVVMHADLSESQFTLAKIILETNTNLAFTFAIISSVVLLHIRFNRKKIFGIFASYGRMSLTNYVSQVVFGVLFFYGFGLGMYRYIGITWSIILSAIIFYLQALLSRYWMNHFYYGPLEWLWRALTFFNFKLKFKR